MSFIIFFKVFSLHCHCVRLMLYLNPNLESKGLRSQHLNSERAGSGLHLNVNKKASSLSKGK